MFAKFVSSGLRCSIGTIGPGIDVRGIGYVVVEPSVHRSGRRYVDEVLHGPDDLPLAPLPEWMWSLASRSNNGHTHGASEDEVIVEGQRNARLTSLAGTMRRAGFKEREIAAALLELNHDRCRPSLREREVRSIAASIARYPSAETAQATAPPAPGEYIESITQFLAEDDPPLDMIFQDLLPCGVIMLIHGEPRSRKSLLAFELAMSAATGTAPLGLRRFQPSAPVRVLYVQEEDPRSLTAPACDVCSRRAVGMLCRRRCMSPFAEGWISTAPTASRASSRRCSPRGPARSGAAPRTSPAGCWFWSTTASAT